MIGSIFGDILGSVFEKIPGYELRKTESMTDDSYLTLATLEWMLDIDHKKLTFLYEKNLKEENKDFKLLEIELKNNAERKLIKWFDIGENENSNSEIPIFSPGFSNWVKEKKEKIKSNIKHKGNTNGCLMRNSPIPYISYKKKLPIDIAVYLSTIFCEITHKHEDSINAVKKHTEILYLMYEGVINRENYKEEIKKYTNNINPLEFWYPTKEKLEGNPKLKFIWDAKTSLDISLSAIYYSESYIGTIDFCNATDMDTDTYCAISGALAEKIFGISNKTKEYCLSKIKILEANELIDKVINI